MILLSSLLLIFLVTESNGSDYVEIITNISKSIGFENCFYMIGEKHLIQKTLPSLKLLKIPIYINDVYFNNFNGYTASCKEPHIKVIIVNDAEKIRLFFEESRAINRFLAFSTVLVVKSKQVELLSSVFTDAIKSYAAQIILIRVTLKKMVVSESFRFYLSNKNVTDVEVRLINKGWGMKNWEGVEYKNNIQKIHDYQHERKYEELNMRNVRISVFNCTPFFYQMPNDRFGGIEYYMVKELIDEKHLEFVFYKKARTGDFWETVEIDVSEGFTDMAVCSQWLTGDKSEKRDVTTGYIQQCVTMLVPKPYPVPYSLYVIFPLTPLVWYLSLLITILMVFKLYITAKIQEKYYTDFNSPYISFGFCVTHVLRALSQSSVSILPESKYWIFRYLILIWIFYSLLVTTGYMAAYTSLMTTPKYTKPINTFQDVLDVKLPWGKTTYYFVSGLKTMDDPTIQKFTQLFMKERDLTERNARISNKNYGVVLKRLENNFITETDQVFEENRDILKILQDCFLKYYTVVILRRNSPLKGRFDKKIMMMIEGGLFEHWMDMVNNELKLRYIENFFMRTGEKTQQTALTLEITSGFFYLLIIGLILSVIVFIMEILYHKYLSNYQLKINVKITGELTENCK